MQSLQRLMRRLRLLARTGAAERRMDAELRHHIELETADLVGRGWPPADAAREARRRFGGLEQVKEQARDARGTRLAEDLAADLRHGARLLRRTPGFTAAAVLTFALGIGAATSIFSVVYGVLLRPLPYADPDRLVVLWERNIPRDRSDNVVSLDNFEAWQARATSFAGMAAIIPTSVTFTDGPQPERIVGAEVTAGFFGLLGVAPALGRDFSAEDHRHTLAMMLSDGYWRRRFGGDPSVVGRVRTIAGRAYTIVGVMPAGFDPPRLGWLDTQDVWFPMPRTAQRRAWGRSLIVLARLAPGVSHGRAAAEMRTVADGLAAEIPADRGWSAVVTSLAGEMTGAARTTLLVLLGAVALLLLIAVTNVSLLTVVAMRRRGAELAMRRAMGATDRRIFRQLLTQSLLLAGVGAAAGLASAPAGLRLLLAILPPDVPRAGAIRLDAPVLLLSTAVAALAAMAFGVASARTGAASATEGLARAGGDHRATPRTGGGTLVAIEIALALALTVMAALMGRSLMHLRDVDLGFDPAGTVVARVGLPGDRYGSPASQRAFFDALLTRVRSVPGVEAAGIVSARPLSGIGPATTVSDPASALPPGASAPVADVRIADDGALQALGIPILAGRPFDASEDASGLPQIIVTRDLADTFWPGGDAVGRRLHAAIYDDLTGEIVGVVPPIHLIDPRTPARPAIFLPASRFPDTQRDLVVRTSAAPESIVPTLRAMVAALDRSLPLYLAAPLSDLVSRSLASDRFTASMLAAFAAAALALAAIGVFGVLSADVASRRKEIGIRLALGSTGAGILGMLARQALRRAAAGIAAGTVMALFAARAMRALLFGVTAFDPVSLVLVAAVVLAVALGATLLPGLGAIRRAPLGALRES